MNYDDAREKLTKATRTILDAEAAYELAVETGADAEAVYRRELADAFKGFRDDGEPVEAARIRAHGVTAPQKRDAIAAAGMVKVAAERLEDARDSRRSLWRLIEWASAREMRAAHVTGRMPENAPGRTWP